MGRAHGVRVGLFTSPHLLRYPERIRIDGDEVAEAELCTVFEQIEAARGRESLTYFEFNTLAALLLFRAAAVELTVLEVGLGGRLDATNLVDADVAVLCSVGLDHCDWLGDTLDSDRHGEGGHLPPWPARDSRPCAAAGDRDGRGERAGLPGARGGRRF